MNIKIVEPISDNLVVSMLPFGSRVYGTATLDSDFDYVVLVNLDLGNTTLQWSGQFEYSDNLRTENVVDYTYVGANKFEELSLNGSNNALFEANYIRTTIIAEARNAWNVLEKFYTYESEKLFLGLAKRDLEYPDRMEHVKRSIWIAQKLANKEIIDFNEIKSIKNISGDKRVLKDLIKQMRTDMNIRWKKI